LRLAENIHSILDGLYCHLDVAKFNQVFRIIITNAFKFTPKGGNVVISAELRSEDPTSPVSDKTYNLTEDFSQSHTLRISIEDSGCGLTIEEQQLVFSNLSNMSYGYNLNGI
jgi:signal transduction histidine kinase